MDNTAKKNKTDDVDSSSFECPDRKCTEEFNSPEQLDIHLNVFGHRRPVEPAKVGLYDQLRIDWVQRFQTISLSDTKTSYNVGQGELETSETDLLEMGWALHKSRSTQKRFSKKVRDYLQKKFEIGLQTARKEDPAQVADDMRRARNAKGERMFTRTEWLTKLLVLFFSSRLSARQRLKGRKEFTRDEVTDDLDEESEEKNGSRQDENVFDEVHDAVVSEIGVIHPVMYDVCNLCEMVGENKLSSFKVKMLRVICTYLEIRFKTRVTKSELVKKLTEMVLGCSCLST